MAKEIIHSAELAAEPHAVIWSILRAARLLPAHHAEAAGSGNAPRPTESTVLAALTSSTGKLVALVVETFDNRPAQPVLKGAAHAIRAARAQPAVEPAAGMVSLCPHRSPPIRIGLVPRLPSRCGRSGRGTTGAVLVASLYQSLQAGSRNCRCAWPRRRLDAPAHGGRTLGNRPKRRALANRELDNSKSHVIITIGGNRYNREKP